MSLPAEGKWTRHWVTHAPIIVGVLVACLPVIIGISMMVAAPGYFHALWKWPIGVVCLGVLILLAVANVFGLRFGIQIAARGKVIQGLLVVVASYTLFTFPAVWIVLLAPALVILFQARS